MTYKKPVLNYVRGPQPALPESQNWYIQEELRKLEQSLTSVAGALGEVENVAGVTPEADLNNIEFLDTLPATGIKIGQVIYQISDNTFYRWGGTAWLDDVISVFDPSLDLTGQVDMTSFVPGIEPIGLYAGLPTISGYTGPKLILNTVDGKLYRLVSGAWTAAVPTSDLVGTLNASNFATNIRPVEVVGTLPTTGNFAGRVAFLTTDNKLYRYGATGWTASVNSADINGQLVDAQIAALSASKVTGQLSDSQLSSLSSAKLVGTLVTNQLADLAITTEKIAADSVIANKIQAGAVTATKIAASAVTADAIAANAITSAKIEAGAVVTAKLAAGAVQADNIAAGAIVAGKIATNAVTSDTIAANSIVTGKIATGAVSTDALAANSVVAGKIAAGAVTATAIAANSITGDKITAGTITAGLLSAGTIISGTAQISDGIISGAKIQSATITGANIADATITSTKIGDAQITSAKIGTAQVDTLRIAGNAITIPVASFSASSITMYNTSSPTVASVTINSSGAPKFIQFTCGTAIAGSGSSAPYINSYSAYLYRNGVLLNSVGVTEGNAIILGYVDTYSAASPTTYSVVLGATIWDGVSVGGASQFYISVLEVKR